MKRQVTLKKKTTARTKTELRVDLQVISKYVVTDKKSIVFYFA